VGPIQAVRGEVAATQTQDAREVSQGATRRVPVTVVSVDDVPNEAVREGTVTRRVPVEVEALEAHGLGQEGRQDHGALAAVRAHRHAVEVQTARGRHRCVKFSEY